MGGGGIVEILWEILKGGGTIFIFIFKSIFIWKKQNKKLEEEETIVVGILSNHLSHMTSGGNHESSISINS